MTDIHASRSAGDEDLFSRASRVIDAVVRRRCRSWKIAADVPAEIRGEVLLRLMRRLRDPDAEPIERLDDYIAGITSRVIDDLVRSALPEWARLKHRIRYILDHDDRFVVTVLSDGRTICSAPATPFGRRRIESRAAESLARTMLDVLREAGGERTIDEMVNGVAMRAGIAAPVSADVSHLSTPRAAEPDVAVESRQSLVALWKEIAQLPRRQRLALLLNARDAAGDSVVRLLLDGGVITLRELALAIDVPEPDLEPLIGRLPMRDADIAAWLQVTRQQVINLRSAARDRLARRTSRPR